MSKRMIRQGEFLLAAVAVGLDGSWMVPRVGWSMRIRTDSNVQAELRYTRQGKVLVAVTSFTTAASRHRGDGFHDKLVALRQRD